MRNLLSISADHKTVKGEKLGVLTGILYLAPADMSGHEVCAMSTAGCRAACLNTAGRGCQNNVQSARIDKTILFFDNRELFMSIMIKNIEALIRKAKRQNMIPAVRLNGTSDLPWEKIKYQGKTLMEWFPDVQFYDYSKIIGRTLPDNYHLTFSLAENNDYHADKALKSGPSVAVVMDLGPDDPKPLTWKGHPVINGDESDVRFKDPDGHIVALSAKGKARKDTSGFVRSAAA